MNSSKITIKKAEAELNRISELRQEMEKYKNSSLKRALLFSCDLFEQIWKLELCRLRMRVIRKKTAAVKEAPELLTRAQLEEKAFNIHTPDHIAGKALKDLIANYCLN